MYKIMYQRNNRCMFFLCLASVAQSPECLWESSISCVAIISLFLVWCSIPLREYTTTYLSTPLLMGVLM